MAPTKPLVMQQADACYYQMGLSYELLSEMTGSMPHPKRAQQWRDKRIFFVTPQVVKNDLARGLVQASDIVCLVVDEAHRASGTYAYVTVARAVAAAGARCRIVALTATPAKDAKGVQRVIDNLLVAKLEVKSEQDIDVKARGREEREIVEFSVLKMSFSPTSTPSGLKRWC